MSVAVMLQAAKLDPQFSDTFLYIGKYYEQTVYDLQYV